MKTLRLGLLLVAALVLAACDSSDGGSPAADTRQGEDTPAPPEDVPAPPSDVRFHELGFALRVPTTRTATCDGELGPQSLDYLDQDWICTLDDGDLHAYVYVQANQIGCHQAMGPEPDFEAVGGWIAVGGQVTPLEEVVYAVGHHAIDTMEVVYGGKRYAYGRSTMGAGWRPCRPMDCFAVYDAPDGGAVTEDGCTCARTRPAICVQVAADGTVPPLEDTFAPCEDDTQCP